MNEMGLIIFDNVLQKQHERQVTQLHTLLIEWLRIELNFEKGDPGEKIKKHLQRMQNALIVWVRVKRLFTPTHVSHQKGLFCLEYNILDVTWHNFTIALLTTMKQQ